MNRMYRRMDLVKD